MMNHISALSAAALGGALIAAGCAGLPDAGGTPRKEIVRAVTQSHHLVSFNAGQPGRLLSDVALKGLAAGETVLGIDYRVARGELYALGSSGRVFRVDIASGQLTPVGNETFAQPLNGRRFGFDFNPAATASASCPTPGRTCEPTRTPVPWSTPRPMRRACRRTARCTTPPAT